MSKSRNRLNASRRRYLRVEKMEDRRMMAVVFAPAGSGSAGGRSLLPSGGLTAATSGSDLPFDIQFNFGPEIRLVPAAMRTMELAAQEWESIIADPVTIFIDVDLDTLAGNALGGAISETVLMDYPTLRSAMVNDAIGEFVVDDAGVASLPDRSGRTELSPLIVDLDDRIVQYLPGNDELRFNLPPNTDYLLEDTTQPDIGDSLNVPISGATASGGLMSVNRATLKALGALPPTDPSYLEPDAGIIFTDETVDLPTGETAFLLDFTPEDGVAVAPQFDAYSVAVHEIGHALGFVSSVDSFGDTITPTPMDLFRFPRNIDFYNPRVNPLPDAANPFEQFQTFTRELRTNVQAMSDFGSTYWGGGSGRSVEVAMADIFGGDQTSHWLEVLGEPDPGLMSPTIAAGVREPLTAVDIRMLDLIGWDIVSPDFNNVDVSTLYTGPVEGGSIDPRANFYDVDGNGFVSALDALLVINDLNSLEANGEDVGRRTTDVPRRATDVNGDGQTSAIDALAIINFLNRGDSGDPVAVDEVFSDLDEQLAITWLDGPALTLF